ncbi:hypothetical protein ACVOMV_30605 [Mesorhizobium atlanticum]
MKMRIPSPNNMHFARAGSIVVFTGLFAWLLLSAFRSSVVDPQTTLQGFLKAVPLGIASSYYDQVFLASLSRSHAVVPFEESVRLHRHQP